VFRALEQTMATRLSKRGRQGKPEVAKEILSYFLRHPNAADSLEGIAEWRILEEKVRRSVEETKKALDWLVRKGFLQEEEHLARPIFQLNSEKLAEMKRFLEGDRD
jgi:hypothetical protein